ncbi:MAG: carboxylesterase/lipase family protein [Steroidobacter sp.]|nr:carboxylesterase/lipase family protein [Steroidobacter sp.]
MFRTVETASGKVQGIVDGPVVEFRGIPYGASTAGSNRFMPPRKPASWTGVRECFGHGPISPQGSLPGWDFRTEYFQLIFWDRHVGGMSEDCLTLNISTPGVNDGAKRAVLVSFHGGNFDRGSGNAPIYDGKNLATFGDVVVVTVNHRLGLLGYLGLAEVGAPSEFASSGVAGALDMALALEWVRDNIAAFGGDPSRVMIFGQSGGGGKVAALMAMPRASGLFHRAAIQSGGGLGLDDREEAAAKAQALLKHLGLSKNSVRRLQQLPWQALLDAQSQLELTDFAPVLGGRDLPHHAFDADAPVVSANVPLIVGSTLEDAAMFERNFDLDSEGLRQRVMQNFPEQGSQILQAYLDHAAGKSPFLIQAQIASDRSYRRPVLRQIEQRSQRAQAPVYNYLWTWPSPAYDGKFGAVHCIDVAASFNNARDPVIGSGSAMAHEMCARLASAWVNFARTGSPRSKDGLEWAPFESGRRATMIFGDTARVELDPRGQLRRLWEGLA